MMPARDSIELIRLRWANAAMTPIFALNDDVPRKRKFRKAAEEAPFMIRTLGLGSGLASLAAKKECLDLADMIAKWLISDCPHLAVLHVSTGVGGAPGAWTKALLEKIAAADRNAYRQGQIEALGYASWIKRLAQAFCPKDQKT